MMIHGPVELRAGGRAGALITRLTFERLQAMFVRAEDRPVLDSLLRLAHDPGYEMPPPAVQTLLAGGFFLPLVADVRAVVLSSLYGYGENMVLTNPDARKDPAP